MRPRTWAELQQEPLLPAFLLARIAEDEQAALIASPDDDRSGTERGEKPDHWQWVCTETDVPVPVEDIEEAIGYQNLGLRSIEHYPTSVGPLPNFVIWHVEEYSTGLQHIVRHDPARVMRGAAALRLVVAQHSTQPGGLTWACAGCPSSGHCNDPDVEHLDDCPTLRALALTWAEHPDYLAEWAPKP